MDKNRPRGPPVAQMKKLRPGEGTARPRIHTSRYPMQGSAFCFMDWVSPFPKAQRGAETGPRSHSKSFVFLQHQAAPPCHSKCPWNDCTPGKVMGEGGDAPPGAAKDIQHLSGWLQGALALSAGSGANGGPRGHSCFYKKGQSPTLASSPFSRVCSAPCSSDMPFYLIPTQIP